MTRTGFSGPSSAALIATHAEDASAHHAPFIVGTYAGNDADDRAIPHGLGVVPTLVLIIQDNGDTCGFCTGTKLVNVQVAGGVAVTDWDATNFRVENTNLSMNTTGKNYTFVAFP